MFSPVVRAQAPERVTPGSAAIHGAVTTQNNEVFLPGVIVTVLDPASGTTVAETTTDGTGKYRLGDLKPQAYGIRAYLDGFAEMMKLAILAAGLDAEIGFDLGLAKLTETVTVVADQIPREASTAMTTSSGRALEVGPVKGDNFQSLLPMLPGVVRTLDGHISIKGATPTQSSVQINATNVTDPSTGDLGFDLPNDAVQSVDVLTNPYAAEFGRFSSGVTTVNTTRGGPQWSFTPNGFIPRLYRSQQNWWNIQGLRSFRPRFALGGPLVKDKVFLFENVLYRYIRTPIPGLPDKEAPVFSDFKTFTRLDVNRSPRNTFNVSVATFPQQLDYANLNTFNRIGVSTNLRQSGFNVTASNRAVLSSTRVLESTIGVKRFDVRLFGQGTADMLVTPDGNDGNFFNRQTRDSLTYQWVESLTWSLSGRTGEHLLKLGSDVLYASYDGTSESSPVNVLRENGTLAERLVFGPMTRQHVSSTELALVAQDHWRIGDRVSAEIGARVDHDGVLGRTNFTPRAGVVIGLSSDGDTILRGGIGLFYDRTPLNVGAFQSFEPRTITRYGADGLTPLAAPSTYINRMAPGLQTPYSRIWNIELDQRINDDWSFKINHFQRDGHHDFIVNPVVRNGTPEILLASSGESRYQETEFAVRFAVGERAETTVSYVRSHGAADLNGFEQFFGNARNPLIQPNQFGLSNADTPTRVLIRGTYQLPWQITVEPLVDLRSGFPLSTFAEDQSYIGQRNGAGRYPFFTSFDFSASRPVKLWKYRATVGVRMFNAFDVFNPRDAQRNIGSPAFGTFHNMVPRDFQTFIDLGR